MSSRSTSASPPAPSPRIVAVGTSAGGLAALRQFLSGLPAGQPFAVVVLQHQRAGRESMLAALLQDSSAWPVVTASDGVALAAGTVLVVPAGQDATVTGSTLHLQPTPRPEAAGVIDRLLSSVADAHGAGAVGVLLSGMGHDGMAGLHAIRAAGGLTAVQLPDDAEYAEMPGSARAAGLADLVGTAQGLPTLIAARGSGRPAAEDADDAGGDRRAPASVDAGSPLAGGPPADDRADLGGILQRLRAHAGQGFERYKPSTVRRRVERRMSLHGLRQVSDYLALLDASPGEVDLLFKEMMIGVTGFFRDPDMWRTLQSQLLPTLAAAVPADTPLRAWCAGCSTGQEPYSLAMSWLETSAGSTAPGRLQIFATDLSAGAVNRARAGSYALNEFHGVSQERLARHFMVEGGRARVRRELRDRVLFARHDVTADPPFGRLDLLMCRNVLIYLQATQQQDLIRLFHHCLKPGGWLVLGLSETFGHAADLFSAVDGWPHIYRRRDATRPVVSRPPLTGHWLPTLLRDTPPMTPPESRPSDPIRDAERLVLDRFAPASILVNRAGDVLWSCGPAERFLEPADGRTNVNVLAQARTSLRTWLASALGEALGSGSKGVELRGLRLVESPGEVFVDVSVVPLDVSAGEAGHGLIVIRESSSGPHVPVAGSVPAGVGSEAIVLAETVRRLQRELLAATEDFQSANEELQSSNEELTTSREEMQSMNEELQAINAELQAKLDALALEQSDMKNLLDSTQIATLFLDERLNVRRFTEQARQVINLRDGDAGRPLSDLTTRLGNPDLVERAREVLRTLVASEQKVPGPGGSWFAVRVLPYRTVDNVIAGVVITFTDVTLDNTPALGPAPVPPA